jgi:GntR family transcriptional regulator, phosphonate transport system regulatory protein
MTQPAFPQTDLAAHEALTAGVSLWRRIADELEQSIARGTFKPGSKLPGEVDIAQRFGVNRHTVRRAIAALAQRGLVRAERGSGTFIEQRRIPYPIRQRTRFSENVGGAGHTVSGRLIAHAVEDADAEVARILKLKPGAPALRLELLRHADRVPVCAATTWLDAQRFPGAARVYTSNSSVTRMLAHFGVRTYVRKSTRVTAAIAEAADAALLRITLGRPMLVVDSVDVDGDGAPVLTTHARFAADRLELVIET